MSEEVVGACGAGTVGRWGTFWMGGEREEEPGSWTGKRTGWVMKL